MNFSETYHLVPALKSADHTAAVDSDSINMGLVENAAALIQYGDMSVASQVVKVFSGATAGTKTTALTFRYKLSPQPAKTAGSDVWASGFSTSAALTVTFDTDDDKLLVIEVQSDEMTAGEPWLTIEFGAEATIQQHAMVWICKTRYDHTVTVI